MSEFVDITDYEYFAKVLILENEETKAELLARDMDDLEPLIFQVLRSNYDVRIVINPELRKKYKSTDLIA